MLQFYASYGQREAVLQFFLHMGTGLSIKRFLRYISLDILKNSKQNKLLSYPYDDVKHRNKALTQTEI